MKKRQAMRRARRTLCVLLPILVFSLAVLFIVSRRVEEARSRQETPSDYADAETIPALTQEPEEPDQEPSEPPESTPSGTDTPDAAAEGADDTPAVPEPEPEPVTLLFTGDVLLSDYVLENYDRDGISGVLSPVLLEAMQTADITVINNEFPFSTRGEQAPDKQFTFRVNPDYVRVLTDMGVDIAGIANNHVLDFGPDALLDTFETLENAGIDYMGAGSDLSRASALITKEVNGKTFGFLAASRVIPVVSWDIKNASPGVFTTYDPALLLAAIKEARTHCDFLSVFVHWGIERDEYPQDYQVTMAQQYIDAGADLVVGAHPHVLQGIAYYENKPVFYSLGNFIFNREIPRTAVLRITVPPEGSPVFQLIAASAANARTIADDGDKRNAACDYLESISEGIVIDDEGIVTQAP
ncbi:CapA family protein [Lachnospiraceae bacterium 47-T17]